ncbi:hypothetical protein BD770DRAFT_383412 [Pilaira anomala]|nr:hypothetical protein BD770DRAFT_383412 [Pilaira anomala]
MNLINLPNELLQIITNYLPQQSVSRLCLTCTQGYQLFLPKLYRHIELGHRTQTRQLELGLIRNSFLKETVKEYTQSLTLNSRQGGNSHWSILSLFEQLPKIKHLQFRDFLTLSVTKVNQVLNILPRLEKLDFSYCDLTTNHSKDEQEEEEQGTKKQMVCNNLVELNLIWTDFSADAIRQLVLITPNLNRVILGANHNRHRLANDESLLILTNHCQTIKDLSISLQQVKESSICQLIRSYGPQLETLSIRCEGNETIQTISQYTKRLQQLTIRCNNSGYNNVMNILEQCQFLTHLEMVSWPLQDVPSIVLDQIRCRQDTSASFIAAPTSLYIEGIKRTVALDRQDLQEIRRLCLYSQ